MGRLLAPTVTFTQLELEGMQRAQEAHMMDTCLLEFKTATGVDALRIPVTAGGLYGPVQCGLDLSPSHEVNDGSQVAVADAVLRLPLQVMPYVTQLGTIFVTARFGEQLPEQLKFAILGGPETGPSGTVLPLRRVP